MNPSESDHYGWLVAARSRNQDLLLRLFRFGTKHCEALHSDHDQRTLFALLVGVAFSLWRAAFLTDTKRTWPAILDDANKLLETVVRDNTINYPQDRATREWMGGYYLNNARWRLAHAREKSQSWRRDQEAEPEAIARFDELHRSGIETERARDSWDALHNTLVAIFERLEAKVASG